MKKIAIAFTAMLSCLFVFAGDWIEQKLEFSMDNKEWTDSYPVLKKGETVFYVKQTFAFVGDLNVLGKQDAVMSWLTGEKDFASANRGYFRYHDKNLKGGGKTVFGQQLPVYWAANRKGGSFVYKVDVGAREKGKMGIQNLWNKNLRKHVNAPLPAAAAYVPGTYVFHTEITFYDKNKKHHVDYQHFTLTVAGE